MTRLGKYEMETIVNYNTGEQTAVLYTRDKAVMRKLDALVSNCPGIYKLTGQDGAEEYRQIGNLSVREKSKARSLL